MKKQYLWTACLALLLLAGCSQDEIGTFEDRYNSVRFQTDDNYNYDTDTYKAVFSFLEHAFEPYQDYTFSLVLVGNKASHPREIAYDIDKENTTAPEGSYEILQAVVPSDSIGGKIVVRMYNTDGIQNNGDSYTLALKLKASAELQLAPAQYISGSLTWSNDITPPPASLRWCWFSYNALIQSSLPAQSNSNKAYSSNALKAIVNGLGWDNWDVMEAHPDYIQRPNYYTYAYLPDYRLLMTAGNAERAFAAKLGDYIKAYNAAHPDAPLTHNEGILKGQPIEARQY